MSEQSERLLEAALALSTEERAELAAQLISSIDGEEDSNVDAAWNEEIGRRIRAFDEGGVQGTDWRQLSQQIRSRIRSK